MICEGEYAETTLSCHKRQGLNAAVSAVSGHHHAWEDVAPGASRGMDGALLYHFNFLRKVESKVISCE